MITDFLLRFYEVLMRKSLTFPLSLGCHKVLADCCWGWWVKWLTKGPKNRNPCFTYSVHCPWEDTSLPLPLSLLFCFAFKNRCYCRSLWLSSSSWSSLIISHNLLPGWILLRSQPFCSGWFWEGLSLGSQMEYWFMCLFWWLFNKFQSPQRGELSQLVLNNFREEEAKSCLFYFHCF